MLDHVARDHEIKLPQLQVTINQSVDKLDTGIRSSSDLNAARRRVNSSHRVTKGRKPAADVSVPATEIADRLDAVEFLHQLDKHIRQLLARRAIPCRFCLPFKFGVSLH